MEHMREMMDTKIRAAGANAWFCFVFKYISIIVQRNRNTFRCCFVSVALSWRVGLSHGTEILLGWYSAAGLGISSSCYAFLNLFYSSINFPLKARALSRGLLQLIGAISSNE